MLGYIWPIALVVVANVFYNITTKSTPSQANAFLSLAVTYCVAAACAFGLYLVPGRPSKAAGRAIQAQLDSGPPGHQCGCPGVWLYPRLPGWMEGKHRSLVATFPLPAS